MDGEVAAYEHDRAGRADLEALGDTVPGDRRNRAGPVREDHPQEVLPIPFLPAFALAHDEGARDLVAVGKLAQGHRARRSRRGPIPVFVLEERLSHSQLKVEADPDETLRQIGAADCFGIGIAAVMPALLTVQGVRQPTRAGKEEPSAPRSGAPTSCGFRPSSSFSTSSSSSPSLS